ncbi:MAG: hypothetical protein U9N87_06765, partial [Planctomycetota bacterium]|nr:hypothetical protein [Planctomycetota bacterium]
MGIRGWGRENPDAANPESAVSSSEIGWWCKPPWASARGYSPPVPNLQSPVPNLHPKGGQAAHATRPHAPYEWP